jgi:hypothetical protein
MGFQWLSRERARIRIWGLRRERLFSELGRQTGRSIRSSQRTQSLMCVPALVCSPRRMTWAVGIAGLLIAYWQPQIVSPIQTALWDPACCCRRSSAVLLETRDYCTRGTASGLASANSVRVRSC